MRRRWAALAALACVAAQECPEFVEVTITLDGRTVRIPFGRRRSLLGQALAAVAIADLTGDSFRIMTPECASNRDALCVAGLIALEARDAYVASGCGSEELARGGRGTLDVLQIGAHVGNSKSEFADAGTIDPVYDWLRHAAPVWARALLVEPLRESFERLVGNYAGARAQLYYSNLALTVRGGLTTLHVPIRCAARYTESYVALHSDAVLEVGVDAEGHRKAFCFNGFEAGDLVASLDRGHVINHISTVNDEHDATRDETAERMAAAIAEHDVPSSTWDTVLDAHSTTAVGFLVIDAEGFDCELLAAFPFRRLRPSAILLEKNHCPDDSLVALQQRLADVGGYRTYDGLFGNPGQDVLLVHDHSDDPAPPRSPPHNHVTCFVNPRPGGPRRPGH